jgi:hypothetical protein
MSNFNQPIFLEPTLAQVSELCSEFRFTCEGDADLACLRSLLRAGFARWGRPAPQPIPVSERLPELRGQFERILCVARSSGGPPVGNIQLADRLISAVLGWLPANALPLPAAEVE